MFKNKLNLFFLYAIIIFGLTLVPTNTDADPLTLPTVQSNHPSPIVDGNITTIEWQDSIVLNSTGNEGIQNASIRVVIDSINLFIGFNYSFPDFVPVNDTIPVNSTLNYNNATHDWLVLQIDNNLDQQDMGSLASPDDLIVIDQYNSSVYDAFANGNKSHPISLDQNNSGSNDVFGVRSNFTETVDDQIIYEFNKTIGTNDNNGSDFDLNRTKILQFRFLYWLNSSGNATYDEAKTTSWFTLRINETGTGLAEKEAIDTLLEVTLPYFPDDQFKAFETILSQYGFQTNFDRTGNNTIADQDLIILILGGDQDFGDLESNKLVEYVKQGGRALVFLSDEDESASNLITSKFGVSFLPNSVLVSSTGNSTIQFSAENINSTLPFSTGPSLVTDQKITNLQFKSNGINITNLSDKSKTPYILWQDYQSYNIFDLPSDLAYDSDDNGLIDENDVSTGISLGLSIDLLKGGRITLLPTTSLLSDEFLTTTDNIPFLLRLIPWNSRITNTINIHSVNVDTNFVSVGDKININVEINDIFNNPLMNSPELEIKVNIIRNGNIATSYILNGSGPTFTQELDIKYHGWMDIKVRAFLLGNGFAESEKIAIFSQNVLAPYNDLKEISPILLGIFIMSLVVVAIIWIKTK